MNIKEKMKNKISFKINTIRTFVSNIYTNEMTAEKKYVSDVPLNNVVIISFHVTTFLLPQ